MSEITSTPTPASQPRPFDPRGQRQFLVAAAIFCLSAFVTIYWLFPLAHSLFPPCGFYRVTGWHCPGCGGTRCCIALLHGRWGDALHDHILFVLVLPYLAWIACRFVYAAVMGYPWRDMNFSSRVWLAFAAVVLVFTVLRNIPVYPLTLLAPLPG